MNCVFCDHSSFAHQVIFETEHFYVLYARTPLSKGHSIIITKEHAPHGTGLHEGGGATEFIALVNTMLDVLYRTYNYDGVNVFANFGEAAGQSIPHAHYHILPRFEDENYSPFALVNDPERRKTHTLDRRACPKTPQKGVELLHSKSNISPGSSSGRAGFRHPALFSKSAGCPFRLQVVLYSPAHQHVRWCAGSFVVCDTTSSHITIFARNV